MRLLRTYYRDALSLLLTVLAIISFLTAEHPRDLLSTDMIAGFVITAMVILSVLLRFVQEWKADAAAAKLKAMINITATVTDADGDVDIIFHYNGDPVMYPGVARRVSVCCRKNGAFVECKAAIEAPAGWKATPAGKNTLDIVAKEVKGRNTIGVKGTVAGKTCSAQFTILGPDVAKGYPSAVNVEYCPTCRGRKGTCVCART